MEQLTKEEMEFIASVLKQLTFKPGSSNQILQVEKIIDKLNAEQTKKV